MLPLGRRFDLLEELSVAAHFYRDVQRYPDAIRDPGIVAFRFDGPIVFANRDFFKSTLLASVRDQQELDGPLSIGVKVVPLFEHPTGAGRSASDLQELLETDMGVGTSMRNLCVVTWSSHGRHTVDM